MKTFRKRQRALLSALPLLMTVTAIFFVVLSPMAIRTSAAKRKLPIYCVQRDDKCVSLTFDAAWGNEDTQTLIDILGRYGVKATFFVVGDWVERYPESVKALSDAGHEIMSHSDGHEHFSKLSTEEIIGNLNRCNDKIEAITGVRPTLFRCPYGEYDDHVVEAVSSLGMYTIQWDVDSLDWKDYDAKTIYQRVSSGVGQGSIVLFHNAALHTPEALPEIIDQLLRNGYRIIPVSEMLLKEEYIMDHTGRMCPAV